MSLAEALVTLAVWAVTLGTTSMIGLALVRRSGRVSRRHTHRIPARWVASPTPSAILHRRLRRAVRSLRQEIPATGRRHIPNRLDELASEIEDLAAAVDRSLLGLGFAPTQSRLAHWRRALDATHQIEDLSIRLRSVSIEVTGSSVPAAEWSTEADRLSDAVHTFEQAAETLRTSETEWTDAFLGDSVRRQG